MKRPIESDYTSFVAYARALEQYCDEAEKQEPVGWMDSKLNPIKREWVGLTDDEIDQGLLRSDYALQTAHAWRAGVVLARAR